MVKTFGIPAFWRRYCKSNVAESRHQPCFCRHIGSHDSGLQCTIILPSQSVTLAQLVHQPDSNCRFQLLLSQRLAESCSRHDDLVLAWQTCHPASSLPS
jgi:hypothetical protein